MSDTGCCEIDSSCPAEADPHHSINDTGCYGTDSSCPAETNTSEKVSHESNPLTGSYTGRTTHAVTPGNRITCPCVCCFSIPILCIVAVVIVPILLVKDDIPERIDGPSQSSWTQFGDDLYGEDPFDERFGRSISLSSDGNRLAVGAPWYDGTNGDNNGRVRVFELENDTWNQLGQSLVGDSSYGEYGSSVSLSTDGSRVAIGAPFQGQVKVFELDDEKRWVQLGGDIMRDDTSVFGNSVSLSYDGKRLVVGAPKGNFAQVFTLEGEDWVVVGGAVTGDTITNCAYGLGMSVSFNADGTRFAVPKPKIDCTPVIGVFEAEDGKWLQVGEDIDTGSYPETVTSVSLSSDGARLAVAGPSCCVKVLDFENKSWVEIGRLETTQESGDIGSVSLSSDGKILAIGAKDKSIVRIFEINDGEWFQRGEDLVGVSGSQFGFSVSLSSNGATVAIGAPDTNVGFEGNREGHVQTFRF